MGDVSIMSFRGVDGEVEGRIGGSGRGLSIDIWEMRFCGSSPSGILNLVSYGGCRSEKPKEPYFELSCR